MVGDILLVPRTYICLFRLLDGSEDLISVAPSLEELEYDYHFLTRICLLGGTLYTLGIIELGGTH